ncbi:hypothetical protein GS429_12320 [Natronorubrum sp. JWXQ-INN-674]|uniref:DUF4013 domain-containing protein n=1 Tax=Natronorubrum halalkaliphilum TaxID=2691917 RepID=A0A6B0VNX5_9EURY|nr:hypothetical protein [Natronorubrum halalkaliphilum]MXV62837.1 hypothetical protein [Natronorubrum halalkaliphilum]
MVPAPDADDNETVADGSGARRSTSSTFVRHVSRVLDRFDALLPFALVPFALSILEFENVRRALDPAPSGSSFNIEFAFPTPLLDLWSFADPPPASGGGSGGGSAIGPESDPFEQGSATQTPEPTGSGGTDVTIETPFETIIVPLEAVDGAMLAWLGLALVVYAVISAVIAAGYLGGIDRRLRDEPASIPACIIRYAPRLVLYHLVVFGAFVALVPVLVAAPALLVLAIPAVIVLGYLFYAVPFLFIVDDARFLEAFRHSYGYGLEGGPYLRFAFWHVAVAAATSLALSILLNSGGVGFVVGLLVATPLALVLTAATISFVQELVEPDGRETATLR